MNRAGNSPLSGQWGRGIPFQVQFADYRKFAGGMQSRYGNFCFQGIQWLFPVVSAVYFFHLLRHDLIFSGAAPFLVQFAVEDLRVLAFCVREVAAEPDFFLPARAV